MTLAALLRRNLAAGYDPVAGSRMLAERFAVLVERQAA